MTPNVLTETRRRETRQKLKLILLLLYVPLWLSILSLFKVHGSVKFTGCSLLCSVDQSILCVQPQTLIPHILCCDIKKAKSILAKTEAQESKYSC